MTVIVYLDMAYANLPETLSTAVCVEQNTGLLLFNLSLLAILPPVTTNAISSIDSPLYQQLNFTPSDVHCVMDEVQATIEKMRVSDQLSYIQKSQDLLQSTSSNRNHHMSAAKYPPTVSPSENICIKSSSIQLCHVPSPNSQPFSSDQVVDKDGFVELAEQSTELLVPSADCSDSTFHLSEFPHKDADQLIIMAASTGHIDMIQYLISSQPDLDLNKLGTKDMTALMEAANAGYFDIVVMLPEHGADVNVKTSQGNTALMYACANGNLEIVQYLISRGADIEDQNDNGHTALMEAASSGHVDVARYLVAQGCNINVHSNEYKETALTLAAYKGHLDMVRFLIEVGIGQEHRAEEMHTALMEASMDGHVEVARLLIESGAQVNMPPDSFESPLTLAACGGHVELALLLLECGANIEEVNDEGYTALMEAAREGHEEMVALLISNAAQINATTEDSKETALSMASGAGCLEVVNLLIKAGAEIELGSNTPLMEAAQEGHLEIVKRLHQLGANVNATNSSETPLTLAAENGHLAVVKYLISVGAKVDLCVDGGRTALMKAAQAGRTDTVALLIASGANVNKTTANNEHTPLSLACSAGHSQVVKLLLNSNADQFHRLKDNSTMLIEAAKGGHTDVVQILFDYQCLHVNVPNLMESALSKSKSKAPKMALQAGGRSEQFSKLFQPQLLKSSSSNTSAVHSPPKVAKKVSPSSSSSLPSTTATTQPLSPQIKVIDNSTFKLIKPRTTTPIGAKKSTSPTPASETNSCYKMRNKFVYIPQSKRNSFQQVPTNKHASQSNLCGTESIRTKSSRSLSDSFIHDHSVQSFYQQTTESKGGAPTTTATSSDNVLTSNDYLCKEYILIYNKMIASVFFSMFNFFRNPILDPILTDTQLIDGLIDEINEMLEDEDLPPQARKWLKSRLKVVDDFKQHNFFFHQMKHLYINKKKIKSESDIIIPGIVLKNFLSCKNIMKKLQLDSATIAYCQMFFDRAPFIDSLAHLNMHEIHDSISDTQFSVDYTDSGCQTDPDDYGCGLEQQQQHCLHKEKLFLSEENISNPLHKLSEKGKANNSLKKISELNPEQIIFSISNGNIEPKQYVNDQLFDLLKKLSMFYLAPNKKELVFDLLYLLNNSPPDYQHIIEPFRADLQKNIQEQALDEKATTDDSLCSSSSNHSSKENLFDCKHDLSSGEPNPFDSNSLSAFAAVKPSQTSLSEPILNQQPDLVLDSLSSSNLDVSKLTSTLCSMTPEQLSYLKSHFTHDELFPFPLEQFLPESATTALDSKDESSAEDLTDDTPEPFKGINMKEYINSIFPPQIKEEIASHNNLCSLTDDFLYRFMNESIANSNISLNDLQEGL